MMEEWAAANEMRCLQGRRVLDTAEGVLIGLRGCDPSAAFKELLGAAQTHDVPIFSMAAALVELATNRNQLVNASAGAQTAALQQWGELFADRATRVRKIHA
jgi:hypothetical protein